MLTSARFIHYRAETQTFQRWTLKRWTFQIEGVRAL